VVLFRCTKKLLDRLPGAALAAADKSTTALGDWYFKVLPGRPQWLLLGVSEKSRLPIVLPARELSTFAPRFLKELEAVLHDLGVTRPAASAELAAMSSVKFAKTIDRRVLGSLNDFAFAVQWSRQDHPTEPLHALNLKLAETPILPLHDSPDRITRRLLETRIVH